MFTWLNWAWAVSKKRNNCIYYIYKTHYKTIEYCIIICRSWILHDADHTMVLKTWYQFNIVEPLIIWQRMTPRIASECSNKLPLLSLNSHIECVLTQILKKLNNIFESKSLSSTRTGKMWRLPPLVPNPEQGHLQAANRQLAWAALSFASARCPVGHTKDKRSTACCLVRMTLGSCYALWNSKWLELEDPKTSMWDSLRTYKASLYRYASKLSRWDFLGVLGLGASCDKYRQ